MAEARYETSVWTLLEEAPEGVEATAALYNWSTNFPGGEGPFSAFLDLIGWSDEHMGMPMFDASNSQGYMEQAKLGEALIEHANNPGTVGAFVDQLMEAEAQG